MGREMRFSLSQWRKTQGWVGDIGMFYIHWAAPCFGSLYVKFPPGQNIFALTVNLGGESAQMEKLTQPYLRRGLCAKEESEPWLMSGLKLSPFLPASCIPLPWSRSFIGVTSFKERNLVKKRGLGSF